MNTYYQNTAMFSEKYNKEKKYWDDKLTGAFEIGGFFPDIRKIDNIQREPDEFCFDIPIDISTKMLRISNMSYYSIYTILVAAVTYLIYKYSSNDDIIVGFPVTKQKTDSSIENKLIPIRNYINVNERFKDYLARTGETIRDAIKNQNMPFKKGIKGNGGLLYRIVVLLESIHDIRTVDIKDLELLFSFSIRDSKITGHIYYDGSRFFEDTVKRIVEHIINFLKTTTNNPEVLLKNINILSNENMLQLMYCFNNIDADFPKEKVIHELFEEQVRKFPNNIAVKYEDSSIIYTELNSRANKLAHLLREYGVKQDSIVALLVEPSIDMIIGILGILKAGGAYLPIDPEYPEERVKYILEDSGTSILLIQSKFENIPNHEVKTLKLDTYKTIIVNNNPEIINKPNDLAYVIYTSGTSGKPKGVMIEHKNVVRLMYNDRMQFDFTEKDIWTLFHSYCFDFSVWEMYGALLYGGRLHVIPRHTARDVKAFFKILKDEKVTILNQTPSAFYRLIEEILKFKDDEVLYIRNVIFGGEALKPILLKNFHAKYPDVKLINMYGITETTVHVTYKEITDREIDGDISNIGKPIPTLTAYIMDKDMKILPGGAVGELCVGGEGIARGYLKREQLTLEKFIQNPYKKEERLYRSGDLVRMLYNGDIEYIGRLDHQVKIRGHRIELGEIENILLHFENVIEVVVMARTDENNNNYLCAYIVGERKYSVEELREYLFKKVPDYMIPSYFIQIDKIPLTQNGKIERSLLPEPDGNIILEIKYEAPRNEVEDSLVEAWQKVLQVNSVGINDNFFALGGDSIKALRLVNTINNIAYLELQIINIYQYPTIKEFAQWLTSNENSIRSLKIEETRLEVEKLKQTILENPDQAKILPENMEDIYPMSDIEQGMIYYYYRNIEDAIYFEQLSYLIKDENINLEVLERALNFMIEKHDILRTSFNLFDFCQPLQVVHKSYKPDIDFIDIKHIDNKEQNKYLLSYLKNDRNNTFDLAKPLWRARVFSIDKSEVIFAIIFHHAIFDGWSVASFITELSNTYYSIKDTEIRVLIPEKLKYSYKDFVIEQLSIKKDEEILNYWKKELDNYKKLNLRKLTKIDKTSNEIKYFFDNELSERVKILADRHNTSVKNILLVAYTYMFNMLSCENDIIIGLVEHNRPICEDSDKILGCFLNTVPFRLKTNDEMKWRELIEYTDNKTTELKFYGRLPLHEILKSIENYSSYDNPLFDTLFNYVDFHILNEVNHDIDRTNVDIISEFSYGRTNTIFDFTIYNSIDGFQIEVVYDMSTFTKTDIDRLIEYFLRIIDLLIMHPEKIINKNDVLSETEKQKQIVDFNNTQLEYPKSKTIHEIFEEQVKRNSHRIAVVDGAKSVTYEELNKKANQIAKFLKLNGVLQEDIVGIISNRSLEMIAAILGIIKAGGAYLPIDPEYPIDRVKYMIEDSRAKILLLEPQQKGLANINIETFIIDDSFSDYETDNPCSVANPNSLAYIMYTSGSTGKPKGVMIEHKSVVRLVKNNTFIQFKEDDRILQIGASVFDASTFEIWGALLNGLPLYLFEKSIILNANKLAKAIEESNITIMLFTVALFNQLIQEKEDMFKSLRYLLVGGDVLNPKHINILRNKYQDLKIINGYGPTENTTFSTCFLIDKEYEESIPIGKPITNSTAYIVDSKTNLLPLGVMGELCVGGDGLARGYLNNPELTIEKFIDNPFILGEKIYKTGDLARWLPDGNIEFCGRIDQQVKIRGFRIELDEVKNQLLQQLNIIDVVVLAKEDKNRSKYLCAYIVADKTMTVKELRDYLLITLPEYMIPSYFVQLDSIPFTVNGKIDKKALPEPDVSITTGVKYEGPKDEIEERIGVIWREILELDKVGVNDNFLELGGHSLKATVLANKLGKAFGIEISISKIYNHLTIRELAESIRNDKNSILRLENNNTVLIKTGIKPTNNLFLVHQGNGDIEDYRGFCNKINDRFDCWGIRSDQFEINDKKYYSIHEIAEGYVRQIKRIQPVGPYYLMGWCIGGTIVFEIARLIEQMNDRIDLLLLVDSFAPNESLSEGYQSIELEASRIPKYINIKEYYSEILGYLNNDKYNFDMVKSLIHPNTLNAVPEYYRNNRDIFTNYVNIIGKLDIARANYFPENKLSTQVKFFYASYMSNYDCNIWNVYCKNPIDIISIEAEHYSMFKDPYINKLVQEFNILVEK